MPGNNISYSASCFDAKIPILMSTGGTLEYRLEVNWKILKMITKCWSFVSSRIWILDNDFWVELWNLLRFKTAWVTDTGFEKLLTEADFCANVEMAANKF